MSRQVDKKYDDLDKKFSKVLEIMNLEQGEFAMACGIQPGTISKGLARSSFSRDIVDKIYKKYKVRKEYWVDGSDPIFDEKGTYVEMPSASTKDPVEENRILKEIIRRMGDTNDYLLKRIKDLEAGR